MYEFLHTNIAEMSFVTKLHPFMTMWLFDTMNTIILTIYSISLFPISQFKNTIGNVIRNIGSKKKDHVLHILHKMRHSFISSRFYGQHIAECVP